VRIVNATVHVNPLVLAFPLLALTGAVLLLARGSVLGLRRARPGRLPRAAYLAFRRLAGTPAVAVGALVGVAVPIGVLVYSAALSGSTAHDVQRKYETNVGAQLAFGTLASPGSTPDLHGAGTLVSMIQVDPHLADGTQVRMLGLDPATFGDYAFQAGELGDLIGRLGARGPTLDALLVNAPPGTSATAVDVRGRRIPLRVVGTRESFPGLRDPFEPLLVVNRAALPAQLPVFTDRMEELWTDPAHEPAALAALQAAGVDPTFRVSPTTFLDTTGLRPVTWLFGYLRALAYLTGTVAVTALAFAFTARTRRRALSYYLARRMGLSRSGHRRSIAVELGTLLALSWACGVGLAVGAVGLVYRLTDAYPKFPPPPLFPLPAQTIVVSALITVLVGLSGTVLLQRLLDRITPGDLLRA
jgi:putative ABC transport system permease protein